MAQSFTLAPPRTRVARFRHIASLLRHLSRKAKVVVINRLLESKADRQARIDRAFHNKPTRLVFVCHGNIMRSAFAVRYLSDRAPEMAERIVGAGTHASGGREAEKTAALVAMQLNVDMSTHRSTPLLMRDIVASDIVIGMDRANEANIIAALGHVRESVFLIGDVWDGEREVLDPYGKGEEVTRTALQTVSMLADKWFDRFAKAAR